MFSDLNSELLLFGQNVSKATIEAETLEIVVIRMKVYIKLIRAGYVVRPMIESLEVTPFQNSTEASSIRSDTFIESASHYCKNELGTFNQDNIPTFEAPVKESEPCSSTILTPEFSMHDFKTFSRQNSNQSLLFYVYVSSPDSNLPLEILNLRMKHTPILLAMFDHGDISFTSLTSHVPSVSYCN
ncbi:hypothetical protein Ciccas_000670 [Cichlidogyrus casuarinus]|uniref:Uncharacterized protein n=1 Tax=Cichlidogyrus casuarinus TaxID=1844966 RepID=A0ABD2QM67_9PLAT